MKTVLSYAVAEGMDPRTRSPLKRPYLTRRQVYDSEGVVDHGLNLGHIRGKKHDLVGVLNGCIATIKELIKMGFVVDLDGWLLFYLALTGQVGDDLALTSENDLKFRVRALKDLKVNMADFSFERVNDEGLSIKVESVSSPGGKKDEIIKTKAIVVNGKNLAYNADWGDSVKVTWTEDNEAKELTLTPSEQSETYLRFDWPTGLADVPAGTDLEFSFRLHGAEDAPVKSAKRTAKLIVAS